MSLLPVRSLIADFQRMLREHWEYAWSAAEKGKVSCSGAFTWAYRQHGLDIYQGSNRIARRHVLALIPMAEARAKKMIVPGMAAFKVRQPGDKYYQLPGDYKPGGRYYTGDLGDYYHIGLVDEDVGFVLNAQSAKTGFVRSPISQNWSHVGFLNDVDYGEEQEKMLAKVVGGRLNVRVQPNGSAKIITQLKDGAIVNVINNNDSWAQIVDAAGNPGYVMLKYLDFSAGGQMQEQMQELQQIMQEQMNQMEQMQAELVAVRLPRTVAMALRDALNDQVTD